MPRLRSAALVLVLAMGSSGCVKTHPEPFPLDVGYQPLEANEASLPAATANDPTPEVLGAPVTGHRDGHDFAHGQGYVKAAIADVWSALQDPMVSAIHGPDVQVLPGTEPFPLSFSVEYTVPSVIGTVEWESAYRAGPLEGTLEAPQAIGMRYQEVLANQFVRTQSGSLVATEVNGKVTALAFVTWLDATDSGPADAWGAIQDWYNGILAKVAGGS